MSEGTTQGDPLAMAMYVLAMKPLIDALQADCPTVTQVWYANNATGAATCSELRKWWDSLVVRDHGFGYNPNFTKTHLIVKKEHHTAALQVFTGTNISITVEGKCHLGLLGPKHTLSSISQPRFSYGFKKLSNWLT